MTEAEFFREIGIAGGVSAALVFLYTTGGLMTVIVTATLFDSALRRVEVLRAHRAKVSGTLENRPASRL